eukprot:5222217-Pleurochrysis_carterae.AAC.3
MQERNDEKDRRGGAKRRKSWGSGGGAVGWRIAGASLWVQAGSASPNVSTAGSDLNPSRG